MVRRLLQPALTLPEPVRLACYESPFDKLLGDLAAHTLDVVLSDAPVPPGSHVRAFDHLLGETGVSFFGTKELVRAHRRGFPRSLDGAPMLMPLESLTLRRSLDEWLARRRIAPRVVARARRQRAAQGLRRRRPRHLRRAQRGRGGGDGGLRRRGARPRAGDPRALLRDLGGAPARNPAVVAITGAARDELFRARRRKPAGASQAKR